MHDINVPALVKRLRARLGLTQEQFAHEVGVTFSTVNQWENGRRRPQPFLLKRLLEMEASLDSGRNGRLLKGEARAFKKRWEVVNAAELQELAETPLPRKFRQLAALMASAGQLGWRQALASESDQVRDRWVRLRRAFHA